MRERASASRHPNDDAPDATVGCREMPEKLSTCERIEDNLFRGESRDVGAPQVFGGQVLGQALVAASRTVEGAASPLAARLFPAPRRSRGADRLRSRPQPRRRQLHEPARRRDPARAADPHDVGFVPDRGARASITRRRCRRLPPPEELRDLGEIESELLAKAPQQGHGLFPQPASLRVPRREPDGLRSRAKAPGAASWSGSASSGGLPRRPVRCTAACSPTFRITTCSRPRRCRTASASSTCSSRASTTRSGSTGDLARRRIALLYAIDSPSVRRARFQPRLHLRAATAGWSRASRRKARSASTAADPACGQQQT